VERFALNDREAMPCCNSVKAAPFVFLGPISYRCHPRHLRFRQKNPRFPRYIWPDLLQYPCERKSKKAKTTKTEREIATMKTKSTKGTKDEIT
jgi:hypothetical protein